MKPLLLLALFSLVSAQDPSSPVAAAPEALESVGAALAERVAEGAYHGVVAVLEGGGERVRLFGWVLSRHVPLHGVCSCRFYYYFSNYYLLL